MPHKEIIRSVEIKSREAFLLLLAILTMLIIGVVNVEASDEESLWNSLNERGSIELILDDTFDSDINRTIEYTNQATVEQAQNQEASYPQVNIPSGVNVRSLEANAATIQNFPRGAADVIGRFYADATSNFGRAAQGTWLVVSVDGQTGAVFADFVNQADGTDLTATEMANAGVPEFTIEGGIPTPPAEEDTTEEDTTTGGDGDDEEAEVAATDTPETLTVPEVPSSITTTISVYENGNFVNREVTVTVNPEQILPLPFGMVDLEAYPSLETFADLIEATMVGGNRTSRDNLRSLGIHGIYLGSTASSDGSPRQRIAIPRADGTWVAFAFSTQSNIAVLSIDGTLTATEADAANNLLTVEAPMRLRENRIDVTANPIVPGDSAVFFFYSSRDPETGVEDQGPFAQGQRGSCEGRNTDEVIDFITSDSDNICVLSNGEENPSPALTITGIAANNE